MMSFPINNIPPVSASANQVIEFFSRQAVEDENTRKWLFEYLRTHAPESSEEISKDILLVIDKIYDQVSVNKISEAINVSVGDIQTALGYTRKVQCSGLNGNCSEYVSVHHRRVKGGHSPVISHPKCKKCKKREKEERRENEHAYSLEREERKREQMEKEANLHRELLSMPGNDSELMSFLNGDKNFNGSLRIKFLESVEVFLRTPHYVLVGFPTREPIYFSHLEYIQHIINVGCQVCGSKSAESLNVYARKLTQKNLPVVMRSNDYIGEPETVNMSLLEIVARYEMSVVLYYMKACYFSAGEDVLMRTYCEECKTLPPVERILNDYLRVGLV